MDFCICENVFLTKEFIYNMVKCLEGQTMSAWILLQGYNISFKKEIEQKQ